MSCLRLVCDTVWARAYRSRNNAWRTPQRGRGALLFCYQPNLFARGKMRTTPAQGSPEKAGAAAAFSEARPIRVVSRPVCTRLSRYRA